MRPSITKCKLITKAPIYSLENMKLTFKRMKNSALLFSLVLIMLGNAYGQENQTWQTPMHEVKFIANGTEEAIMKVDPALNYADLSHDERF